MDAPKRILIVDDEPNVRLVFRTALEATGYLVTEAADGDAALAQLRKLPTDLILLDLKMPVVDGMETLRRLRDAGDETPVVVVTANGSVTTARAPSADSTGLPGAFGPPRSVLTQPGSNAFTAMAPAQWVAWSIVRPLSAHLLNR